MLLLFSFEGRRNVNKATAYKQSCYKISAMFIRAHLVVILVTRLERASTSNMYVVVLVFLIFSEKNDIYYN